MRPIHTKAGCLKCHAFQGYKVGDVRGGVNVSIPFAPYEAMINDKLIAVFITHGGIWVLGLIGIAMVNVRSKKRNVELWKIEEEKIGFMNILDSSHNEIYIFETETFYFVYANKHAQEKTGYTMDELKQKSFFEIQTIYSRAKFRELVKPILKKNIKSVTFETNNITKHNEHYPAEVRIQVTHSDERKLFVAIVLDITERKEANEIKTTYEQLVHTEKLSALGKLTGSIAHEFNNPLYGVTSILEQLNDYNEFSKNDKELVVLAIKECDRMSNLIRKLRDFYRPSSGRAVEFNVNQIIDDMLLLMNKMLMKDHVSIVKHYARDVIVIKNIEDKIKQVLLNVIQNAEESITDDSGTIYIYTELLGENVLIRIEDTGAGISEEDLSNIFAPFFTTKGHKGTGLGLSVCYGIIKECGGNIYATSELGKGTRFTIELPIKGEKK